MSGREDDSAGWSVNRSRRWRAGPALPMPRRAAAPVALLLALAALLLQATPASAVWHGRAPTQTARGSNTELVMSGTGPGEAVNGFIANPGSTFDPVVDGYPDGNPTAADGFTPKGEGFAGIILGRPTDGSPEVNLYCIDILTATFGGIGYELGTWDSTTVPNVGYVARLLNEYYPNTNQPADAPSDYQRAAAVQAAIWFFTDRYVVSTSDRLYDEVVKIVDHIRLAGPVGEQPPPTLTITPSHVSGPAHKVLGPFTVTTNHPPATVTATGGSMFSDSAGTVPIAQDASVPSGTEIWVRSTGESTAVLQATSKATVPTGNVYVYDGNTGGVTDAQHLILAKEATLTSTVQGTAEFLAPGSLVVKKTIAGDAAGSQARVVIHVACDDGVARPDFVIPAGAPAGTTSRTYRHIAAGTTCTVIETSNGGDVGTGVVVTGDGQEVAIPAGGDETVQITDTYSHVSGPSSLLVTKTIAGPLAGHQGPVTIQVVCNGTTLSPDFVIPAGTPAGSVSQSFDNIPAGSMCTVTETADGATDTVAATVSGNDQTVAVPAGEVVPVNVMDVYAHTAHLDGEPDVPEAPSGYLKVTKTIAGPAAGKQGRIAILVDCGGPIYNYAFLIPAHRHAGSVSRIFPDLPTGSNCTVTETADGQTNAVTITTTGKRQKVTIPTNRGITVRLSDTVFDVSAVAVTG